MKPSIVTAMLNNEYKLSFSRNGYSIPFYDDGDGEFWIMENTSGIVGIVRCHHEHTAHEICEDEFMKPIEHDELPEAYGFYLMRDCRWNAPDDTPCGWYVLSDHDNHGEMVSHSVLNCVGDRRSIGGPFPDKDTAIAHCLNYIQEHEIDLIEGYSYQSNAKGTGIVAHDLNGETLELLTDEWAEHLELTITIEVE